MDISESEAVAHFHRVVKEFYVVVVHHRLRIAGDAHRSVVGGGDFADKQVVIAEVQVEVAVEPLVVEEQLLAIGERVAVSAVGTSPQGVGEVLHRVHHSVECPHSLARISVGSVVDMRVADNHILPLRESRSHTAQPFVACGDCATCREEHIVVVGSLETEHNRKFLAGEVLRASGNEGVVEVGVVEREA